MSKRTYEQITESERHAIALGLQQKQYFLLTLHRPANVDDPSKLAGILEAIIESTAPHPLIFPVHPRTKKILAELNIQNNRLHTIDPQGYLEFIYLVKQAKGIITDSGGITEEATLLNVPCLTMRQSTERPETVVMGTNELIGDDTHKLKVCLQRIVQNDWKNGSVPTYWDGHTSERIVKTLLELYCAVPQ